MHGSASSHVVRTKEEMLTGRNAHVDHFSHGGSRYRQEIRSVSLPVTLVELWGGRSMLCFEKERGELVPLCLRYLPTTSQRRTRWEESIIMMELLDQLAGM